MMRFADRNEAGRRLGELLVPYKALMPIVVALPGGGGRVGFEVARALGVPLEIWIVRELCAPGPPEHTFGAIAEGGMIHLDRVAVRDAALSEHELHRLVREEAGEVIAQAQRVRRGNLPARVENRTVLLVDEGIVSGERIAAVLDALRAAKVARVVLATPVAASETLEPLRPRVDAVVCLDEVPGLTSYGSAYEEFDPVDDAELARLLVLSHSPDRPPSPEASSLRANIAADGHSLEGLLTIPTGATGLVLLASASGHSRHGPLSVRGAALFEEAGLATLRVDLLTPEEEASAVSGASPAFDIQLLARRLTAVVDWAAGFEHLQALQCGCFCPGTAAAAALVTSVIRPSSVRAVVAWGGRPELAWSVLANVLTPTLLIVGSEEPQRLQLNRRAYHALLGPKQITVVPGASARFQEPGALEQAARLAIRWFNVWLHPREERARWD